MRPDFPFRPAALPFYYGWVVLVASTLGVVMSAPGQTIGVSVFTESLLGATGIGRVALSETYLIGTLASGLLLPAAGSVVDRVGVRRGVVAAAVGLGAVLAFLSQIDRVADAVARSGVPNEVATFALLSLAFFGLRFAGQGILTLVSRTMLGRWFERRRGLVSSIQAPFSSVAFASSPLLLSGWVAASGWRGAWLEMAAVVGLGMAFVGWLLFRETPEECGLVIDGGPAPDPEDDVAPDARAPAREFTRGEAMRTLAFWVVTLGISNHAMVGTGMAFHIVDLAGEAGLSEAEALAVFLPVTLVSVPTGILIGLAVDRFPIRFLLMGMMIGQVLMFGLAPHLDDPFLHALCIAGWGFSGGFYGPLTVAAMPNFFGRTHLGAIQGAMMMVLVVSSALGPALLARVQDVFGTYAPGLHALALLPIGVFVVAPFLRDPRTRPSG